MGCLFWRERNDNQDWLTTCTSGIFPCVHLILPLATQLFTIWNLKYVRPHHHTDSRLDYYLDFVLPLFLSFFLTNCYAFAYICLSVCLSGPFCLIPPVLNYFHYLIIRLGVVARVTHARPSATSTHACHVRPVLCVIICRTSTSTHKGAFFGASSSAICTTWRETDEPCPYVPTAHSHAAIYISNMWTACICKCLTPECRLHVCVSMCSFPPN